MATWRRRLHFGWTHNGVTEATVFHNNPKEPAETDYYAVAAFLNENSILHVIISRELSCPHAAMESNANNLSRETLTGAY